MPDGETNEALSVAQLYEELTATLEASHGKRHPFWVRGEVQKVYEKGHMYVDLVDQGGSRSDTARPTLNAHAWRNSWALIKKDLADRGLELKAGMVVTLLGYVDLYAPQGRVGFTFTRVETGGLEGDVAKRREELIKRLRDEGLLEANKSVTSPPIPLRVGLVASPQTEGFHDFTGQLLSSGYSFLVSVRPSAVQGESAPAELIAALKDLAATDVDIICLVRGGGSKGDLACFDDEGLARAIAACPKPVWTGIGHTNDESIADLVAHTRAITPTKLGETIVSVVAAWRDAHVLAPARFLAVWRDAIVEEAAQLLVEGRRTVVLALRDRLKSESRHLGALRRQLALHAQHILSSAGQELDSARSLLVAYDPARRLAQGWAIITNTAGEVVRSTDDVRVGEGLSVRVSDGSMDVSVTEKRKES